MMLYYMMQQLFKYVVCGYLVVITLAYWAVVKENRIIEKRLKKRIEQVDMMYNQYIECRKGFKTDELSKKSLQEVNESYGTNLSN